MLDDPRVQASRSPRRRVPTPTSRIACLDAGKHVLVEKPLADSVEAAEKILRDRSGGGICRSCATTPTATRRPSAASASSCATARIGTLQFVDSVRINLGIVQPDIDVFWDLAPHDLSILDFVLPDGCRPTAASAHTAPTPWASAHRASATWPCRSRTAGIAHAHVNWLSPTKIQHHGDRRIASDAWSGMISTPASDSASTTVASRCPIPMTAKPGAGR